MSDFEINNRTVDDFEIIELSGELDAHTASKFENALKELIERGKHQIIVNCRNLSYISSAGLGVFMAYIEDVRSRNGDIKLTNLNPKVYNVFDLLGFPALYDILDDEKDAIKQFSNS